MMFSSPSVARSLVLFLALISPVQSLADNGPSVTLKQATRQDIVSRARDPPVRRSASPVPYPTCANSPNSSGNGDVFATFTGMTRSWFDQVLSTQETGSYLECAQACKANDLCTTAWWYNSRSGPTCRLEVGSYEIVSSSTSITGYRGTDCGSFIAANPDAAAYACCNNYV